MVTKKYHIKWVSVLKLDLYSEKKLQLFCFSEYLCKTQIYTENG